MNKINAQMTRTALGTPENLIILMELANEAVEEDCLQVQQNTDAAWLRTGFPGLYPAEQHLLNFLRGLNKFQIAPAVHTYHILALKSFMVFVEHFIGSQTPKSYSITSDRSDRTL